MALLPLGMRMVAGVFLKVSPLMEGGVAVPMVMVCIAVHSWKAEPPISLMVAGRVAVVTWIQPLKASPPMDFRPLAKSSVVSEAHFSKAASSMVFSCEGQLISESRVQPQKASRPIRFTVLGSTTLRRLEQPLKA